MGALLSQDAKFGAKTAACAHTWLARARAEGCAALGKRSSPGAPPKLTKEQKAQLPALRLRGAPAFGFTGNVWTAERVAAVIQDQWQVRYHPCHVARLLHACGWSRQRPCRRARQRDEQAVAQWQQEWLPALKKRP